jgi:hypothetical protein
MEKPVLVIDAPELSDEGAVSVNNFLQEFILAFESHYYCQLYRHHKRFRNDPPVIELAEGEDLF